MRSNTDLPAVVVEDFREERPWSTPRRLRSPASTIAIRPPGAELIGRIASVFATMRRDYARTIGTHHDFHPRMQSRVEHRIDRRAADALQSLCDGETLNVAVGPLRLTGDPSHAVYDQFEHEYRIPCRLHLPWSWPDLPMWLAVAEVSATVGAVRLSLRSHKRLRYPIRYFHAAHTVLRGVELRVR